MSEHDRCDCGHFASAHLGRYISPGCPFCDCERLQYATILDEPLDGEPHG